MKHIEYPALYAAIAAAVLTVTAPAIATAQERQAKMVLSWAFTGEESPFILAEEGGYFKKEGVAVRVDRGYGSGDTVTKIAAGAYDLGLADLSAVIAFNSKQGSVKVINVFQFGDSAPLAILSLTDAHISKPSDLIGKKIASPPGDSSRIMFPAFARLNNLDESKITWIDVSPQIRQAMLVQKKVDAVSGQSTHLPEVRKLLAGSGDATALKYSDFGLNLYGHAIVATPEYAAKNGDVIRAFLRGAVAAIKKSLAEPGAAIDALAKRDAFIDKNLEGQRLAASMQSAVVTDNVKKNGFSSVTQERLASQSQIVTTALSLPPLDIKPLYRPEFLPARADLQIGK